MNKKQKAIYRRIVKYVGFTDFENSEDRKASYKELLRMINEFMEAKNENNRN